MCSVTSIRWAQRFSTPSPAVRHMKARAPTKWLTKRANLPAVSHKAVVPTIHERAALVIGRMLAKNPAERFASNDELIHDLELALDDLKKIETGHILVTASGERFSINSAIITAGALVDCGVIVWDVRRQLSRTALPSPELASSARRENPAGRIVH